MAGIDPVGAAEVGDFVVELKKMGKTVLLCSHLLSQVQRVCDQIGIMSRGRLLASGDIASLLDRDPRETLLIEGLDSRHREALQRWVSDRGGLCREGSGSLESLFAELIGVQGLGVDQ